MQRSGNSRGGMIRRIAGGVASLAGVTVIVAGIPALLITIAGSPVPRGWPTGDQWLAWVEEPATMDWLRTYFVYAGWLVWVLLVMALVAETVGVATRTRLPHLPMPRVLRVVAASLIGTLAIAITGTAASAATGATHQPVTTTVGDAPSTSRNTSTVEAAGHVTLLIRDCAYQYKVVRGDTLSKIARHCLDDSHRWPEIYRLNKHRYWPTVSGHTTLHNPNLIFPGWVLTLPTDATPPRGATPVPTPTTASPPPTPKTPTPTPVRATPAPATVTPSTVTPGTVTTPQVTPPPTVTGVRAEPGGVRLPGGNFVPWSLVAAISTAWTVTSIRNRRKHTTGPVETSSQPPDPIAALLSLQQPTTPDPGTPTALDPTRTPSLPVVTGTVSDHAARGALVEALTSQRTVVIPEPVLRELLGDDAFTLLPWPQLIVTTDLDEALLQAEVHHLRQLRHADDPDSPPEPDGLLLIGRDLDEHHVGRVRALANTGGVTTIFTDATDSATRSDGEPAGQSAMLDPNTAITLLITVRAAQHATRRPRRNREQRRSDRPGTRVSSTDRSATRSSYADHATGRQPRQSTTERDRRRGHHQHHPRRTAPASKSPRTGRLPRLPPHRGRHPPHRRAPRTRRAGGRV